MLRGSRNAVQQATERSKSLFYWEELWVARSDRLDQDQWETSMRHVIGRGIHWPF